MDNFPGLFGDGELANLDLGGDSFGTQQGSNPTTYSEVPNNGPIRSQQPNNQQAPQQKMTMASGAPQPNQGGNIAPGYPNTQPGYQQYMQRMPGQYQQPGQYMYAQRPMQPNQGVPGWSGQPEHYGAGQVGYQQQQPRFSTSNSQPAPMNTSYPNQNLPPGAVSSSSMSPGSYSGLPQHNPMGQGYPQGSQSIAYQGAPHPTEYPNYDGQRSMAPNSATNAYQPGSQGSQQYSMMQTPQRPPYHMPQYGHPPANQMSMGQPPMMGVSSINQPDMPNYQNSQMPNGSPAAYHAPYPQASPQMSPHPQVSPRPQLSPMPRSMSPHPIPPNRSIASPVSSPAAMSNTPITSSVSPINNNVSAANTLQQLENMVKPGACAGRNTPTNPPCTTPTQGPLPSPGSIYNTGVHSPLGPRAPMSPGLVNRPPSLTNPMSPNVGNRPPMSPQHWQQARAMGQHPNYIQNNYNQGLMSVPRHQPQPSIPQPVNSLSNKIPGNDPSISDSISSVNDSLSNPNGSAIGLSNGPVNSSIGIDPNTNLESDRTLSTGINSNNGVPHSIPNGSMPSSENNIGQSNMPPNVPPSNVSPSGPVPSSVSQLTSSGNLPPQSLATGISTNPVITTNNVSTINENELPQPGPNPMLGLTRTASPVGSMPGSPMSAANSSGNTMVRYPGPQGPRMPYQPQSYRMMGPRSYAPHPQGQLMQPGQMNPNQMLPGSPQHVMNSAPSTIPVSNSALPVMNQQPHLAQGSPAAMPQSPISSQAQENTASQSQESNDGEKALASSTETQQAESNSQISSTNNLGINTQGHVPMGTGHMMHNGPHPNQMPPQVGPGGPINQMPSGGPPNPQLIGGPISSTQGPMNNPGPRMITQGSMPPGQMQPMMQQPRPGQMTMLPRGPHMMGRPQLMPRPPMGTPIQPAMGGQGPRVLGMIVSTQGQPPPQPMQLNLSIEIQQCQQQLQQLYKMPQNMQTQQQINDLQQRLGHMQQQQQQQQQHFIQNQALYSNQAPQAPETPDGKTKKKPGKPRTPKEPKTPKETKPKPKKEPKPKTPKESKPKKEIKPKTPKETKPTKEVKPPQKPKTPKEPRVRKPRIPKELRTPRERTSTTPKRTRKKVITISPQFDDEGNVLPFDPSPMATTEQIIAGEVSSSLGPGTDPCETETTETSKLPVDTVTGQPAISPSVVSSTTVTPKAKVEKKPRVRSATSSRRRPAAKLNLNFKRKRKRRPSESDYSENEGPEQRTAGAVGGKTAVEEEDDANKRRSGRNQGSRKKYVDEIDLQLSDEDKTDTAHAAEENGDLVKPNFVYLDPTGEDSMAVQIILSVRMGEREVISDSEDEEEKEKNVSKETMEKKDPEVKSKTKEKENTEVKENAEIEEKGEILKPKEELDEKNSVEEKETSAVEKISEGEQKTEDAIKKKAEIKKEAEDKKIVEVKKKLELKNKKHPPRKIPMEEFYVKYKAFSYLHCEWRTEEELMKGDKRIQGKIKRFKLKRFASQNLMDFLEEEAFNPDYIENDRILDMTQSTDPDTKKTTQHYLVKWKALPYEDCTWEIKEDVDQEKIDAYMLYRELPSKIAQRIKKRPKADEWKQIDESPVYKSNNQLREYQLEGLNWLNYSYYRGHNCILADEMGLGKTIQSLAFVECCINYGIRGPYLIIAPLSTIPNWQREFEAWLDLNVIVYHGSQASRNMILEYDMYYKDEKGERVPNLFKFHVLITTFEIIIADCIDLKEISWRVCIIDEAHRLKNRNCKLLEGLRMMTLDHRVLLSGTPLQNNVNELFSLLNFLEPTQFSSQEDFLSDFGKLHSEEQVKKLQALLKPMMLRRMKEDVEKSLAPKEETIIEVELTNIQKKYYRAILERNFEFLKKGATYTNVPSLMNTMMELRKCCNHPYLLKGAEDGIQVDYKEQHPECMDAYHSALIQSSGKMVLVDKLLPRLRENGHRVLIFSQMVKLLDIIEDYLIHRKYPYERLDGRIRGNLRQAAIDRYCKPDSDRFVFLLCTKAGGLGINLTAADTVIIYDSDWNPQNDLQAQARCHRIGQQKRVKIYRLLCRNTYERDMFDKASLKLGLDKAVLQSLNTEAKGDVAGNNSLGLSKKDIEDLLKKGAYGTLMDEDNGEEDFCEEDIDQIMSRRATVVTLESEKGSTFSKASFSATNTRSDIDLDDPEFWSKWAKKAEIDTEAGVPEKKELIVDVPRRRSQIRRYGHDEAAVDCSDLESSDSDNPQDAENSEDLIGTHELRRGQRRGRRGPRGSTTAAFNTRGSRGRSTRMSKLAMLEEELNDTDPINYGFWHRSECFKVEKGLLTFGWGRWKELLQHGEFRSVWKEEDVVECARMILLFCIRYYGGDDKIKGFIFDLIAPTTDGKSRMHHNHIGLSAPVPRGRKGKKKLREAKLIASHMEGCEWAKEDKFDTEIYLDQGYSKHLTRHANKVLLRVRLLFYIKQEIINDLAQQIDEGAKTTELSIHPPPTELPPKPWWENEADKSLLVGVYKHGYERYSVMRNDPTLIFYHRCGPPDKAALAAEMTVNINEDEMEKDDKDDEKDDSDSTTPNSPAVSISTNKSDDDKKETDPNSKNMVQFPSISDFNGRLRRLITSYQRNNKKLEMRKEANVRGFDHYLADKLMRRERMAEYIRDRELRKTDYNQRRWSNREQAEFYRTISTFGVEYIRKEKRYDWNKFRMLSRLEKRMDENLTEYFRAFMAMCKRQCGIRLTEQENSKIVEVGVDRLPEERARRVLERVDLLNRLRNDVLPHQDLKKALDKTLPSKDLPHWWIPGKHDLDLIKGVARHGLGRTDYYILYDPDASFREILRRHTAGEPLITKTEKDLLKRKYYKDQSSEEDLEEKDEEEEEENHPEEKEIEAEEEEKTSVKMEKAEKEENNIDQEEKMENITDEKEIVDKGEDSGEESDSASKKIEEKSSEGEQKSNEDEEESKDKNTISDSKEEVTDDSDEKSPDSEEKKDEDSTEKEIIKEEAETMETDEKTTVDSGNKDNDDDEKMEVDEDKVKKEVSNVKDEEKELTDDVKEKKSILPTVDPPLLSLQQMDEAMSKLDPSLNIDSLAASEPTVAQLLAQSAANPIKWPRDRILQTRLEHLMYAVEHKKWPVDIDFQSSEADLLQDRSKCDTPPSAPPSAPSTPNSHPSSEMLIMEATERKRRRQMEEVERVQLQAMLHPNLHLGLSKSSPSTTGAATAAAAAALGLNPNAFSTANIRAFLEAAENDGKKSAQPLTDTHATALKQLQALQGSLDLTIKPVTTSSQQSSGESSPNYLGRRGAGRPRLEESLGDKRRLCDSPHEKPPQDKKRRKLDDIVLGLSSKGKGPDTYNSPFKDSNPLSLLKGSSITLLNKDKVQVTAAITTPKLSSSISITPTSVSKVVAQSKYESSSGRCSVEKESNNDKPGLIKSADLPPGISLPPGIELYRPTDSTKVDKWLEQHEGLMGDKPKEVVKKRKLDFTSIDWSKFSGEEHVPVINQLNGHKITGKEAPKLKNLAQWLIEHTSYDVDPTWGDGSSKERPVTPIEKRLAREKRPPSRSVASPMSSPSTSSYANKNNPLDMRNILPSLDIKNPMTLAALSTLDPKVLASLMDPSISFDPKILASLGLDPKMLSGFDSVGKHQEKVHKKPSPAPSPKSSSPKPSTSQHILDSKLLAGIDPKLLAGLDPKMLAGLDPKLLQQLGLDPKLLAPEKKAPSIDPTKLIGGMDPKMLASLDPKILLGLDPKLLGGLDPKLLTGFDTKSLGGLDHKMLSGMDQKMLANMVAMDPKLAGLDPKLLGLDPKQLLGLDPKLLSGLDPKLFGGLDPKLLGGLDPKLLRGIDPKLLGGLDPKLLGGIDPKLLGGLDPKLLGGLDPKLLGGLDPKLLRGLDPKLLGGIDPNLLAGIDPNLLAGIDPNLLAGIDPKLLGGLDPNLLVGLDPKLLGGLDPKMFGGIDPQMLGGLDPKMLAGLDPKMLAGLDPKMFGLDPKMLGLDPKLLGGLDPKLLGGLDPKMLGGLDPKLLGSMGGALDPKALAALGMGMDPMQMMAGFGALHGMAGLGMPNHLLASLPGFSFPGMPNMGAGTSTKTSKESQRNAAAAAAVAASQANLFSGMFGGAGAAGLMYPPLGMGGLNSFLPAMSSMAQSSSMLLNGLSPPITATAGSTKNQMNYASAKKEARRQEAIDREMAVRKEKLREASKGGLSKEERNILKQKKAERLARNEPFFNTLTNEASLANHLSQLSQLGQIDLTIQKVPPPSSYDHSRERASSSDRNKESNREESKPEESDEEDS